MLEKIYQPSPELTANAAIRGMGEYWELQSRAKADYSAFWEGFANRKIDWFKPFDTVLDESDAPFYEWFSGGQLNVAHQCVDRHLETKKNKAAIIFEGDNGDKQTLTYRELSYAVNRTANMFKNKFNIEKGDRVVLYMPMIPEAAITMLACAKIGAIHSVVFGGFSAEALKDRVIDAEA
ncbi:MAG TPA: acetyl-coenzyme A synthetase, partial [Sulfurovum sp.]|nr:acetyl-coenzyme A synthetase [Sulfurovum sp.]